MIKWLNVHLQLYINILQMGLQFRTRVLVSISVTKSAEHLLNKEKHTMKGKGDHRETLGIRLSVAFSLKLPYSRICLNVSKQE